MEVCEFIIPDRAMTWHRPVDIPLPGGGTRRISSLKNRSAFEIIGTLGKAAMKGRRPFTGPVRLELVCVYAIPKGWSAKKVTAALTGDRPAWFTARPDWDNLGKVISDGLNGIAYNDDAQICDARVAKRYGDPMRTMVRVTQLGGPNV